MSKDFEVISTYTVADGIRDGVFLDVTQQAKAIGLTPLTVITDSIYCALVPTSDDEDKFDERVKELLEAGRRALRSAVPNDNLVAFEASIAGEPPTAI